MQRMPVADTSRPSQSYRSDYVTVFKALPRPPGRFSRSKGRPGICRGLTDTPRPSENSGMNNNNNAFNRIFEESLSDPPAPATACLEALLGVTLCPQWRDEQA